MEMGDVFRATYYISVYKPEIKACRTRKVNAKMVAVSDNQALVVEADIEGEKTDLIRHIEISEIGKRKIISTLLIGEAA